MFWCLQGQGLSYACQDTYRLTIPAITAFNDAVFLPTSEQLEWWTGEKMNFETAADLRIGEFTSGKRKICEYRYYAKQKVERRERERRMWKRWMVNRNPWLRYRLSQCVQARKRNLYWRMWSYPNLRRAWAARRAQGERNRREREIRARREKILKSIELYRYSTRKDI